MAATWWDIVNTNYGPLTTTFTPSSTCLSWLHAKTLDRGGVFYDALGGADGPCSKSGNARPDVYGYHYNDDCYPTSLSSASIGYFSPGNVCPSAWTQAASSTVSKGLTEVYCCPSDFPYASSGNCLLPLSKTLSVSGIVNCPTPSGIDYSDTYTTTARTSSSATARAGPVLHPAVRLRWRDADLASATESNGATEPTSTASPASGSTSTLPSHSGTTSPVSATPGGLAIGAKIAVGVIIPAVVIGVLLVM